MNPSDYGVYRTRTNVPFYVRMPSYGARTINGKPAHLYWFTTNAGGPEEQYFDGEWHLCYSTEEEASHVAMLLPGMQLNPNDIDFDAVAGGAVIFTGLDLQGVELGRRGRSCR